MNTDIRPPRWYFPLALTICLALILLLGYLNDWKTRWGAGYDAGRSDSERLDKLEGQVQHLKARVRYLEETNR